MRAVDLGGGQRQEQFAGDRSSGMLTAARWGPSIHAMSQLTALVEGATHKPGRTAAAETEPVPVDA